jgi:hypothetical protein
MKNPAALSRAGFLIKLCFCDYGQKYRGRLRHPMTLP